MILTLVIYFNAPNFYHKQDKKFIVESGLTLRQVVDKLYQEKIIKHPRAFLIIGQMIKGIDSKVRYGEYFLEKNLSYYKILHKMIRGNIVFRKITIAEGLSSHSATQIIANFAAANYGCPSSRTYIQIGAQYGDGSSRIGSINTTGNQSALI